MSPAEEKLFHYKDFQISYLQWGQGDSYILAFPGFGRTARDYETFSPALKENQCLIALDLFHHSNSTFPPGRLPESPLSISEFEDLIAHFTAGLHIDGFDLIAYSFGSRLALRCFDLFPERVQNIMLFAPDGLKFNPVFELAIQNPIGRKLSDYLVRHPQSFFKITQLSLRLKFIDKQVHHFVSRQLDSLEKRSRVLNTWITYRYICPKIRNVRHKIKAHEIRVLLIFGEHDHIIVPKNGKRLSGAGTLKVKTIILPTGHRLLTKETVEYLIKENLWPGR